MTDFIEAGGARLEVLRLGPAPEAGPTMVFLHEGLGCVDMWRDFPARLSAATGLGAVVYSRRGYGRSAPCDLPRPVDFMHDEARNVLPELTAKLGIDDLILVGHSDGASISLIYAGERPIAGLRGVISMAAHVFVEDISVSAIDRARAQYETTDLRDRLERYHGDNTECAFRGWNDVWLEKTFLDWNIEDCLPAISVPLQVIQGNDDEYGTKDQVDAIEAKAGAGAEVLMLDDCGHSPHRDQPEAVLAAMTGFIARLASARVNAKSDA